VGCVFAELLLGTPLIRGTDEMDQIQKMFDLLGVPSLSIWPSLSEMPLVKSNTIDFPSEGNRRFPKLLDNFSYLSTAGLSLLSRFFTYDYKRRLTASEGLQSEYFREIPTPTEEYNMPTFPIQHNRT
jgi:serine/threonine protein kinase